MKYIITESRLESFILNYLNDSLENIESHLEEIDGEGKLIRSQTVTRGAINNDNIKTSVINGLNKQNVKLDDKTFLNLIETILEQVETNRPKKTKTFIKRTNEKKINTDKESTKRKNKNKTKIQNNLDSDNDIPKYI